MNCTPAKWAGAPFQVAVLVYLVPGNNYPYSFQHHSLSVAVTP